MSLLLLLESEGTALLEEELHEVDLYITSSKEQDLNIQQSKSDDLTIIKTYEVSLER